MNPLRLRERLASAYFPQKGVFEDSEKCSRRNTSHGHEASVSHENAKVFLQEHCGKLRAKCCILQQYLTFFPLIGQFNGIWFPH